MKRIPARFETASVKSGGYVKNLSKEGLFVRSDVLPMPGDAVTVRFETPEGRKLELAGVVRWTTAQIGDPEHVKGGFGVQLDAEDGDWASFFEEVLLG
jgi:hypothetical protein